MKVNPIGIQSYQQLNRRENQPPAAGADQNRTKETAEPVAINPQQDAASSRLAVKAPSGTYAEFLSVEEKQALDILFSRFQDSARFGPGYNEDATAGTEERELGNILDVKA